jgi:DNA polymerase III epsilon subunit-like protein
MNKFVALDFETAQGKRYSACAVGIVVVEDNKVIDRFRTLIKPPNNEYKPINISIHKITPSMTSDSNTFSEIFPIIRNYLNNNTVVCHNADFDIDVLHKTMMYYDIDNDIDFDFHCTMKLNNGNGLKRCCQQLNIPLCHHDPLSDAEACAMLFMHSENKSNGMKFSDFIKKYAYEKCNEDAVELNYSFNTEACRSVSRLKGILLGMIMDNTVNDKEITELQQWSEDQYYHIDHHPFKEFIRLITETTESRSFDINTVKDMYQLCLDFEKQCLHIPEKSNILVLHGIFHGILADGIIKDEEVFELENWLLNNSHLSSIYPYNEISNLIKSILENRIITDEEKELLKTFFLNFVELTHPEVISHEITSNLHTPLMGICTDKPQIDFPGKLFCLTGTFSSGSKDYIENLIHNLGGITKSGLIKSTDYLIVGSLGDPAWVFGSYGRKIDSALKMKSAGGSISIIHECDFMNILKQTLN